MFFQSGMYRIILTVLLKSKLTFEARSSIFDPRVSKRERFEFRDARIQSRDMRIES